MQVSFCSHIPDKIPEKYLSDASKEKTVAVLGSSKSVDELEKYMELCSNVTKAIVLADKNIVHGCGNDGIMGKTYAAARNYSKIDENGKPIQNLAIIADPLWGDEDLENCVVLTSSKSEVDRTEKFKQVADNFIIFPGSVTTLQEASTLITNNYYVKSGNKKRIVLVGQEFFQNMIAQYKKLQETQLIKCAPEDLFTVADDEENILLNILPNPM